MKNIKKMKRRDLIRLLGEYEGALLGIKYCLNFMGKRNLSSIKAKTLALNISEGIGEFLESMEKE